MDQRVRALEEALKAVTGRLQAVEERTQTKKKWFK